MPQPKYYTRLQKFSLFNTHFMFFDTEEYLADMLFIRHRVTVKYGPEMRSPDHPYLAIFCSVRKKDEDEFLEALRELPDKMALFGHTDYLEACTNTFDLLRKEGKHQDLLSEADEHKIIMNRYPFVRIKNTAYSHLETMPKGWCHAFGIELCREIQTALEKAKVSEDYIVLQVKEKYGSLRWYDAGAPKAVSEIIDKYTELSMRTCVCCGKPATRITTGWISPYCDDCLPKNCNGQPLPSVPINEFYPPFTLEGRDFYEADGASEEAE